ncbi:MAG: hypothetical protein ACTSRG_26595 [Candidatus Helarchaeota archaeon]
MNEKGKIGLVQILILITGIFAISYALGSEIKLVSGQDPNTEKQIDKIREELLLENGLEKPTLTPTPTRMSSTQQAIA